MPLSASGGTGMAHLGYLDAAEALAATSVRRGARISQIGHTHSGVVLATMLSVLSWN